MVSIFSPIFKNVLEILIFLGVPSKLKRALSRSSLGVRFRNSSHFALTSCEKRTKPPRSGEVAFHHPIKRGSVYCRPLLLGISLTRYTYKFPRRSLPCSRVITAKSRAFEVLRADFAKISQNRGAVWRFCNILYRFGKSAAGFLFYRRCERVCRSLVAVCAPGGEITLCTVKALCGAFWVLSCFPVRKRLSEIRAASCPAMPCCSGL